MVDSGRLEGSPDRPVKLSMDGNEPITDYKSKTVMMAAERNDIICIVDAVNLFHERVQLPDEVSVLKRTDTYYGPELMVHSAIDGKDENFLINAPGPGSYLHLWEMKTNKQEDCRTGWRLAAEIKAALAAEQPPYQTCESCGEIIRTIEHERKSVLGTCSR